MKKIILPICLLFLFLLSASGVFSVEPIAFDLGENPTKGGIGVSVKDERASGGMALSCPADKSGTVASGRTWSYKRGIYKVRLHILVESLPEEGGLGSLTVGSSEMRSWKLPADFSAARKISVEDIKTAGKYVTLDFRCACNVGYFSWSLLSTGKAALRLDRVDAELVKEMTEEEFLLLDTRWKKFPQPAVRQGPLRCLFYRGFFSDYFMLDLALPRLHGMRVFSASYSTNPGGYIYYPGRPAQRPFSISELYSYDIIILAGTNIGQFSLPYRAALRRWLHEGGGLFVLGGPRSFAQGGYPGFHHSDLKRDLPVTMLTKFDLKREKTVFRPQPDATDHPIVKDIDWTNPMVALFHHSVTVKPEATIVLGSKEAPLLAVQQVGKGRIACLLTTAMGSDDEAKDGETLFWNDPRFADVMANCLKYLCTRKGPAHPGEWRKESGASGADELVSGIKDEQLFADAFDNADAPAENLPGMETEKTTEVELTEKQFRLLLTQGGDSAVPLLLSTMPQHAHSPADIYAIGRAVRPCLEADDFPVLAASAESMFAAVKEMGLSLMGKADPQKAEKYAREYLADKNPRLRLAACRSANEGNMKQLIPECKKLAIEMRKQHRAAEEGKYFLDGLRATDSLWSYAEILMLLAKAGEGDYVADLLDVASRLHIEEIKLRSFLFTYNCSAKIEADEYGRHVKNNALIRPDLDELQWRLRQCIVALSAALDQELADAVLAENDFEKLTPIIHAIEDRANENPDNNFKNRLPELRTHFWKCYLNSERL